METNTRHDELIPEQPLNDEASPAPSSPGWSRWAIAVGGAAVALARVASVAYGADNDSGSDDGEFYFASFSHDSGDNDDVGTVKTADSPATVQSPLTVQSPRTATAATVDSPKTPTVATAQVLAVETAGARVADDVQTANTLTGDTVNTVGTVQTLTANTATVGQTITGQTQTNLTVTGQTLTGQTLTGQTVTGQTQTGEVAGVTVEDQTITLQTVTGQTHGIGQLVSLFASDRLSDAQAAALATLFNSGLSAQDIQQLEVNEFVRLLKAAGLTPEQIQSVVSTQ